MTHYTIHLANDTDTSYSFGIYQEYPDSPGLLSVVWKVKGLPAKGAAPTRDMVEWDMNYGLATTFKDSKDVFHAKQTIRADLGTTWQIAPDANGTAAIKSLAVAAKNPAQIVVKNNMGEGISAGFTLADNLITVRIFHGGESVNFFVHPTYYVALFRQVKVGQLVTSNIATSPVKIEFGSFKTASVTAVNHGGTYKLTGPKYS